MIHYYQKSVLLVPKALKSETWLSETLAQAAVDLVSPRVGLGPFQLYRPIMDYFSKSWDSLTSWKSSVVDYYPISAFGAYLLRHYAIGNSSAALARRILHNPYTDILAVTSVTGTSWEKILRGWGRQSLSFYKKTSDLAAIDLWQIFRHKGLNMGLPMFHLDKTIDYMLFFNSAGKKTGFRIKNQRNNLQFPETNSHIFIYLGNPKDDIWVDLGLPAGIVYDHIWR